MSIRPVSCIIIDDDKFSRDYLTNLLADFPEVKIIECLSESCMAIRHLAIHKPDIVFLDIDMPDKDGISILNEINELGIGTRVIFVTSYEQYVLDALKKNAFDYLVKPVKRQVLSEVLIRYSNEPCEQPLAEVLTEPDTQNKLVIQNAHGTLILKKSDVVFIEADGSYSKIHLLNDNHEVVSKNIGKVEKQFANDTFFKISRSFIININYLSKIDRLRKVVHLQFSDKKVTLKASKEMLYDLERLIHKN